MRPNDIRSHTKSQGNNTHHKRTVIVGDSDLEVEKTVPARGKKKHLPCGGSSTSERQHKALDQKKPTLRSRPLFLHSDEDDQIQGVDHHSTINDNVLTLQTSQAERTPATSKSKAAKVVAAIIVDDDSDDGATFKGFHHKRRNKS